MNNFPLYQKLQAGDFGTEAGLCSEPATPLKTGCSCRATPQTLHGVL